MSVDQPAQAVSSHRSGLNPDTHRLSAQAPVGPGSRPHVSSPRDLLRPVVPESEWHPAFRALVTLDAKAPSRDGLRDAFSRFQDLDGHFIREFQTKNHEARLFELFLASMFAGMGFERDTRFRTPDLILQSPAARFAVEAVTANPRPGEPPAVLPDLHQGETMESIIMRNAKEAGVRERAGQWMEERSRLLGPLESKANRRYEDLPGVQGAPFVLAIQDFYHESSLMNTSYSLIRWLYDGETPFFADHPQVSAVMFCNAGTASKFGRMALQADPERYPQLWINRACWYYRERSPTTQGLGTIVYRVGDPDWIEDWPQGITMFHNPIAAFPLTPEVLPALRHVYIADSRLQFRWPDAFFPEASITQVLRLT
jgi:hypothetical protein